MAGVQRSDIDAVQLYDCYTITVLLSIEDSGFCAKGEGMAFVRDNDLTFAGELPAQHPRRSARVRAGRAGRRLLPGDRGGAPGARRRRRPPGPLLRHRVLLGHRRDHVRADRADRARRLRPWSTSSPVLSRSTSPDRSGTASPPTRSGCSAAATAPRGSSTPGRAARPACPTALDWHTVSGRATVYSFTIARQADAPGVRRRGPPAAGHRRARRGRADDHHAGRRRRPMTCASVCPVTPVFDHGSDGITLLRFRPTTNAAFRIE